MSVIGPKVERIIALQDDFQPCFAGDVDHPIHSFFGMIESLHPFTLVDIIGGGSILVVIEWRGVEWFNAQLFHDLRITCVIRAATRNGSARGRKQGDVRALFGGGYGSSETCHAGTYDDYVVFDGFGDLVIGDGLGGNHKRPFGHSVGQFDDCFGRVDDAFCSLSASSFSRCCGRAAC